MGCLIGMPLGLEAPERAPRIEDEPSLNQPWISSTLRRV